ncbi:MAG: hypothetical protein GY756_23260 [bacterium]|nr:hypothetical protein [bacterium]
MHRNKKLVYQVPSLKQLPVASNGFCSGGTGAGGGTTPNGVCQADGADANANDKGWPHGDCVSTGIGPNSNITCNCLSGYTPTQAEPQSYCKSGTGNLGWTYGHCETGGSHVP